MYVVRTKDLKTVRINVKMTPALRDEFDIAASAEGSDMSDVLRRLIVQFIEVQKLKWPEKFLTSNRLSPLPASEHVQEFEGLQDTTNPKNLMRHRRAGEKGATINDARRALGKSPKK